MTTSLSAKDIELLNLVKGGEAFVNCAAPRILNTQDIGTIAQEQLETLLGNLPDTWGTQDIMDVIGSIDDLKGKLDEFKQHTDRISGLTFPSGGSTGLPDFQSIIGLSNSLYRLQQALGDTADVAIGKAEKLFGSLCHGGDCAEYEKCIDYQRPYKPCRICSQ